MDAFRSFILGQLCSPNFLCDAITCVVSEDNKKNNSFRQNPALSLGLNMTAGMIMFSLIGHWIDQKRGGGYIATLIGMFVGLFYCGYEVWKIVRNSEQQDNQGKVK